jgi:hypothetical protein
MHGCLSRSVKIRSTNKWAFRMYCACLFNTCFPIASATGPTIKLLARFTGEFQRLLLIGNISRADKSTGLGQHSELLVANCQF